MSQTFSRMAATDQRLLRRSCESLIGIATGMLVDGKLSDDEIRFLDTWLADHAELACSWPGEIVYARVREVLADGTISEEERNYLQQTLSDLIGGDFHETGATSGASTKLPLDKVESVTFSGKNFCFTGAFIFGTRKACEKAVQERSGIAISGIRQDLDYLVIGELASREWAYTSHGRKIEKAVKYKSDGVPILIISEADWVQGLRAVSGW
jgi:NAD-dependent DNA ligase